MECDGSAREVWLAVERPGEPAVLGRVGGIQVWEWAVVEAKLTATRGFAPKARGPKPAWGCVDESPSRRRSRSDADSSGRWLVTRAVTAMPSGMGISSRWADARPRKHAA